MDIDDPFAPGRMRSWVERQCSFGARRPGSPAGLASERYLENELTKLGLARVRREPIPITYWDATRWEVTLARPGAEPTALASFPIPYTRFSTESAGRDGAGAVSGPLVYASADGSTLAGGRSFHGAVVVADIRFPMLEARKLMRLAMGFHDPDGNLADTNHPATWVRLGWHLYAQAARRGAVGFIGVVRDQPGGSCRMYAPYGFREENILGKPIPGFWVGRDEATRLLDAARAGATARLLCEGVREPAVTHNIIGEIDGSSDEAVVLSCHHDSPFVSPVEDGTGVAAVLAIAGHFAASRAPRRRRLLVALTAGHFYGSIGTRTLIEQHKSLVERDAALAISVEHIALEAIENAEGRLVSTGRAEPAGVFSSLNKTIVRSFLDAAQTCGLSRAIVLPAEGPLGNYPPTDGGDWYAAGVPVLNYIANPVYLLTDGDAPEWVHWEGLPRVARALAQVIRVTDSVSRRDLRRVDFPWRKRLMRVLRHAAWAKSTRLGTRPVH